METRISQLERQVRLLRIFLIICLAISGLALARGFMGRSEDGVLRARGLVITDAEGRERILIGAPVPAAASRVRTDPEKARKAWGARYPRFDWYASLNHATNGILILNEEGFDQIAIGDPTPDPNIGRRIAPSTGIQINDRQGNERTGWGFFPTLNRVVLGLDTARGTEGVYLVVHESGYSGVGALGKDADVFLGYADPGSPFAKPDRPWSGLLVRRGESVRHSLDAFAVK
jgi:hypothetical protein